jgi:hypothetical protein
LIAKEKNQLWKKNVFQKNGNRCGTSFSVFSEDVINSNSTFSMISGLYLAKEAAERR